MTNRARFLFVNLVAAVALSSAVTAEAQCTLQLSDTGIIRMASGEQRTLTWNSVPGATSYYVEQLIEGLGDPAAPDFALGAPYTESRNFEAKGITSTRVSHSVLYKIRFRYIVTALNRDNPAFQPCSADVLYVVEPDAKLAAIAASRTVPIAGKTRGMNGADYSTALVLTGTGLGSASADPANRLYQGRVFFRPLGQPASDTDPSVSYSINGEDTVVFDDIMDTLGATGIGSLEIVPRTGGPAPFGDAIIENRLPDGRRASVRIPATWGRDHLKPSDSIAIGIRNASDSRLSVGLRSLGNRGRLFVERLDSNGVSLAKAERYIEPDVTALYSLTELFPGTLNQGDRIYARYQGFQMTFGPDGTLSINRGGGSILFLTETGNDMNNPNVVYRESMDEPNYSQGFDRFVIY